MRLRDLGLSTGALPPGPLNAITDVPGVRVGHATVVYGEGPLRVGEGPARTGVTAIHPHEGSAFAWSVPAATAVLNGTGEMTGRAHVAELGLLESPIMLTSTHSVGAVHQACVEWLCRQNPSIGPRHFVIPVVAETFDGFLNDAAGQHVRREHVFAALDGAAAGPVGEGNVGGGTGMRLFGFKGGIGTASRVVEVGAGRSGGDRSPGGSGGQSPGGSAGRRCTVGVLVQGNFGSRADLLVGGLPVGRELMDWQPGPAVAAAAPSAAAPVEREGSIIVVIATDAPLDARQLGRLCRRGMLGLARVGSTSGNTSGDLLIAFSNPPEVRVDRFGQAAVLRAPCMADGVIDPLFRATVEATEEAVLNALVAAETMSGRDGHTVDALPHDRLVEIVRRHRPTLGHTR